MPTVAFGNLRTASNLAQKYTSFNTNVNKLFGDHDLRFGFYFLRTQADGLDPRLQQNQLFATTGDFATFGAAAAGVRLLADVGGVTPAADELHLRNNHFAGFAQDDWKVRDNFTLNAGLRWEYDSEFKSRRNFAPRLGFAWAVTQKTVVRANFGLYYDQFRLGLARNVPAFGGTDQRVVQSLIFPRLLYGSPSFVSSIAVLSGLPGACFSNNLLGNPTDAQIAAAGTRCPLAPSLPLVGVDRLNNIVAAGRAPIAANTVVTAGYVQALTGLSPNEYAARASAAIGQPAGYFVFGSTGYLTNVIIPPALRPTTIDDSFETPFTVGFNVGVQRELTKDMVVEVDYFHRKINNILGVRTTNLPFEARVLGRRYSAPFAGGPILTYGPFFKGRYDALIVNFNKRLSRRYQIGANYTFANATDNSLGIYSLPSDSFIGFVPEVIDPATGRSNATGSFVRGTNNTLVQQAGTFLNGPDRDKGPSDLAVRHIFQVNGLVVLPFDIQVSGIFRAQSGFRFTETFSGAGFIDPDGDGGTNTLDVNVGRNAFTAPAFYNLDMRFAKRFSFNERFKAQVFFEFFNLLNARNPSAIQTRRGVVNEAFGSERLVLPGREGQVGFRFEF